MEVNNIRADGYVIERVGSRLFRLSLVKGAIKENENLSGEKISVPICHVDLTYGAIENLLNQMDRFKQQADSVVASVWGEKVEKSAQHHSSKKKKNKAKKNDC